jgi:hypothetical protein
MNLPHFACSVTDSRTRSDSLQSELEFNRILFVMGFGFGASEGRRLCVLSWRRNTMRGLRCCR